MESSFVILKPDCVRRKLIGPIIARFSNKGINIIKLMMVDATKDILYKHYIEHTGKSFFDELIAHMVSGPIVIMHCQGINCVAVIRQLVGETDPAKALPGSIRGDFGQTITANIIHASDSVKRAREELNCWFGFYTINGVYIMKKKKIIEKKRKGSKRKHKTTNLKDKLNISFDSDSVNKHLQKIIISYPQDLLKILDLANILDTDLTVTLVNITDTRVSQNKLKPKLDYFEQLRKKIRHLFSEFGITYCTSYDSSGQEIKYLKLSDQHSGHFKNTLEECIKKNVKSLNIVWNDIINSKQSNTSSNLVLTDKTDFTNFNESIPNISLAKMHEAGLYDHINYSKYNIKKPEEHWGRSAIEQKLSFHSSSDTTNNKFQDEPWKRFNRDDIFKQNYTSSSSQAYYKKLMDSENNLNVLFKRGK